MYREGSTPESSSNPSRAHSGSTFRVVRGGAVGSANPDRIPRGKSRGGGPGEIPLDRTGRAKYGTMEAVTKRPMRTKTPPTIDVW